jgi:REP element-mobilizing transposase RayT
MDSLRFCQQNKGLEIYAFVIMSNHIHILMRSDIGKLSDTIREFKSFIAKKILENVNTEAESRREWMLNLFEFSAKQHKRNDRYQVWSHENHGYSIINRAHQSNEKCKMKSEFEYYKSGDLFLRRRRRSLRRAVNF